MLRSFLPNKGKTGLPVRRSPSAAEDSSDLWTRPVVRQFAMPWHVLFLCRHLRLLSVLIPLCVLVLRNLPLLFSWSDIIPDGFSEKRKNDPGQAMIPHASQSRECTSCRGCIFTRNGYLRKPVLCHRCCESSGGDQDSK
ncbi:uncharacterized protein BO80DRAFT_26132 [Aspergillus ibericus CBS 121593]|uniref:Uncharacterized protein n=1 Tax=Aspergillus ibericus CBS 121593 TaxID=1448316 RepID=A0A395H480_9EURO|nr:hypothetical protein BO80DRAFT_26132 [Aspergillus ibericus CBS 121593]RAL02556.1 hypothetical protein BO80DRAFT_26132 [Aspergillus ibericus CBS 121593]